MIPETFQLLDSPLPVGLTVIESSAGTGKTTAITLLVPRLLLQKEISRLSQVALVTFTNDAAAELLGRVRKTLRSLAEGPEPRAEMPDLATLRAQLTDPALRQILRRAVQDLDELQVSTIHSFCQQILLTEGTLCGFPTLPEIQPNLQSLLEGFVQDLWEQEIAPDPRNAALTSAGSCSPNSDLGQLSRWWSDYEAEFSPTPITLNEATAAVQDFFQELPTAGFDEWRTIFSQVKKWNKGALAAEEYEALFRQLNVSSPEALEPALASAAVLTKAPGWMEARSKEGKAAKAEIEKSSLLQWLNRLPLEVQKWNWNRRIHWLRRLQSRMREHLQSSRLITYDGLIEAVRSALRGPQGPQLAARLRSRWQIGIIDESQDTDARQMEIFRTVFLSEEARQSGHRLILIGDPKQAIYGFRGADVNTYLEAKIFPGTTNYLLNKTYRSPESLVQAVNAVFQRPDSFLKAGLDFFPATSGVSEALDLIVEGQVITERLHFWIAPDSAAQELSNQDQRLQRIGGAIAQEIVSLLQKKAHLRIGGTERLVQPADFAILVHQGWQADALQKILRAAGVPSIQAGGESVFHSEEAADLVCLLQALESPRRAQRRHTALATRLLGFSAEEIARVEQDQDLCEKIALAFLSWAEVFTTQGFARCWSGLQTDLESWSKSLWVRLAQNPSGERRLTNLRHLLDLLQEAESAGFRRPGELLAWLERARRNPDLQETEHPLRLETDANAVRISTMHAAKGLEYPLVFCPFLWHARDAQDPVRRPRPNQPPEWSECALLPKERAQQIRAEQMRCELEDRLRLAYVALTRAQVKLWVIGGQVSGKSHNPSSASALDWLLREDGQSYSSDWEASTWTLGRGSRHSQGAKLLQGLCASPGAIAVEDLPLPTTSRWQAPDAAAPEAPQALPAPSIPTPWSLTSFSALTREAHPHGERESAVTSDSAIAPNPFATAPGGIAVGTALHAWLESWDFSSTDLPRWQQHRQAFALPEAPAAVWDNGVVTMLEELREAILPVWDCPIHAACPLPQASEWHFQLPIGVSLSAQTLAEIFARHGEERYATLLAQLPTATLRGYLQGFVDRLACANGNWGVVDWKTNKLPGGYGREALQECAETSHYWLQTHLYLVALRRFRPLEKSPIAWLVFLRGVRKYTSEGILCVQPSSALLDDLTALFTPTP